MLDVRASDESDRSPAEPGMRAGTASRTVFWGSAGLLAYAYAGFPLLAAARALLRPRPIHAGDDVPTLTVIIPAYNEEDVIAEKLENTLAAEYPRDRLEVIVASDGSDDRTNERVQDFGDGVRLLDLPRAGKNAALNEAAAAAQGAIIAFTDADVKLTEDAFRRLVAPFADPSVGGVAGERRHGDLSRRGRLNAGKRTMRRLLSRSGSLTSAEGQLHALRRELFRPIPRGVLDDFWISTRVVAGHQRLVYEPEAGTYPFAGATVLTDPFGRKVRMTGLWFRAVWLSRDLLNPAEHGFYAVQLASHKLLRRLSFLPILGLGITGLSLRRSGPVYRVVWLAQTGLHGAALAGYLLRGKRLGRRKVLKTAVTFDLNQMAAAAALAEQLRGRSTRDDMWQPQRTESPGPRNLAPGISGRSGDPS
jgi:glycosyltransferase involved in cell wall biosynthesis